MSKKRVHEVAKELKTHGIELDNKEVVQELVSLGYDVKSHSSSLDEDQASAAVSAILAKRKPKAAEPPVQARGFVVRRRAVPVAPPAEAPSAPPAAPPSAPVSQAPVQEPAQQPASAAASVPEPQPEPVQEAAPEQPSAAPTQPEPVAAQATPSAETSAPEAAPQPTAAAAAPATTETSPSPVAQTSQPMPNPQPPSAAPQQTQTQARPPAGRPPQQGGRPPYGGGQQGGRPPYGGQQGGRPPYGQQGGRPQYAGGQGGRPPYGQQGGRPQYVSGPAAQARPGQPVQPGTPAGQPPAQGAAPGAPGAAPGQPAQPQILQRTAFGQVAVVQNPTMARPTATQAVVVSRPLVQVRRVTPSSTAHKSIPMAPGRKAIGEVREFKVVPDHLGRGREFVDVTKNKTNKKRTSAATETGFKQEAQDAIWGRVSLPIRGKKRRPTKKGQKTQITQMAEEKKVIKVQDGITVSDLGQRMGVRTPELIKKLMGLGKMATANQMVDVDTAELVASDYGWKIERTAVELEQFIPTVETKPEDQRPRPPVVTVMGHVDHGKTSILDAIRKAKVAAGEAGGITQHIGAYTVKLDKGDITFLDTPGHEAFTSMRARGAHVTDVVILVVAGDSGVMPTTREAVQHAKAGKTPIVVAINKMDLPTANPDKVKKELSNIDLLPEDWGGDTIMVPVSAHTRDGLDQLLESVLLQAEVLELKANPGKPAVGTIIEAKLEKGRGPVATVLVQEGTLRKGDAIVTGTHHGKVRTMVNDRGEQVTEVGPGYCAEVLGLSGVPTAGDNLNVVEDEKAAKEVAESRNVKARQAEVGKTAKESLEDLFKRIRTAEGKELKIVLKADVQGSLEAVAQAVNKLSTPKVRNVIVHKAVGQITENDVNLAAASKAIIVGFNVRAESGAEPSARHQGVSIQTYGIIYELIDKVREQMESLLDPIRTEKKLGRAEVRNLFNVPKLGTIAGAAVTEGMVRRNALVRVFRENKPVYTGKIASLRRFKDDVREVTQGYECGIGVDGFADFKPNDIIEAYEIEETRPSLS